MFRFSHLEDKNLGYFQHMKRAFSLSVILVSTGIKTLCHGIFPPVWETIATDNVGILHKELYPEKYIIPPDPNTSDNNISK